MCERSADAQFPNPCKDSQPRFQISTASEPRAVYIPLSFVLTVFFPFQFNASFLHYSDMPGTVLVRSWQAAVRQPEPASTPGADVPVKQAARTSGDQVQLGDSPTERSRCLSQPRQ